MTTPKTKEEVKKKGEDLVLDFISGMTDFIEKKKQGYVEEMVSSMFIQADIISRARKDGIEIAEIMPEIKQKYEELKKQPKVQL